MNTMLSSATDDTPRSAFVRVLSSERRRRMMRGRRRQHLLTVCTLTVLVGFLRAGLPQLPVERPLGGRRLLHATLQVRTRHLWDISLKTFIYYKQESFHLIFSNRTRLKSWGTASACCHSSSPVLPDSPWSSEQCVTNSAEHVPHQRSRVTFVISL